MPPTNPQSQGQVEKLVTARDLMASQDRRCYGEGVVDVFGNRTLARNPFAVQWSLEGAVAAELDAEPALDFLRAAVHERFPAASLRDIDEGSCCERLTELFDRAIALAEEASLVSA